jgi:hypothetical protein
MSTAAVMEKIEQQTGATGDGRFEQLVLKAARDQATPAELRELAELAKARGMTLRVPVHFPAGDEPKSLEREIRLATELLDSYAKLEEWGRESDPQAVGRRVEFDRETERLQKQIKEDRKPEREKFMQTEREEVARQSMANDVRARIVQLEKLVPYAAR